MSAARGPYPATVLACLIAAYRKNPPGAPGRVLSFWGEGGLFFGAPVIYNPDAACYN